MQISSDSFKKTGLLHEQSLIGGEWRESATGHRISVSNPATGSVIGSVPDMSFEETNQAIAAADKAQKGWAKRTAAERADPPPVKWSAPIVRKRRIKYGYQATQTGRDCHEAPAS